MILEKLAQIIWRMASRNKFGWRKYPLSLVGKLIESADHLLDRRLSDYEMTILKEGLRRLIVLECFSLYVLRL